MVSGVGSAVAGTAEPGIGRDIEALARYFVESGQVVPGITVGESNQARSWWWPLPAARDRGAIARVCRDGSQDAQRAAAEQLATSVDRLVRQRLGGRLEPVVRRRGR